MKKSKVVMTMAIAIIAIVAVCSVSFAAWSITTKTESGIDVSIASPVELKAVHDAAKNDCSKLLIPAGEEASFDLGNTVTSYKTGEITTSLENATTKKIYVYATATVGGVENTALVIKIAGVEGSITFTEAGAVEIGALTSAAMTVELPVGADKATYAGKTIAITLNFLVK